MRIIHTADWHLGQNFYEYERSMEHRLFLDWLAKTIEETRTDALLIAGDIFDTPNPSAAAQKMFYDFLRTVTFRCPQLKIIVTAGNHDSGARLEAPSPILESFNITIRGTVHRIGEGCIDFENLIVPLSDDVCCLAVPYLRQGDYPVAESHSEGVGSLYSRLIEIASEKYPKIIVMGHLHASGSILSTGDSSERTVIGGLDNVDISSIADKVNYVALGHLHKAQSILGKDNMRYSGAPLPMSFAERHNRQSVTLVTIENNSTTTGKLLFETPARLMSIPAEPQPLLQVLEAIEGLPLGTADDFSPYLEIRVLVNGPEPTMRQQIEKAIEGRAVRLTRIEAVSQRGESTMEAPITYDELKRIDPMTLANDYYCRHYNQKEMPGTLRSLMQQVIKEIEESEDKQ